MGFKPDLCRPTGFLQCFDTVGLVICPAKIVPEMTYYVSSGTLNPTHSLTKLALVTLAPTVTKIFHSHGFLGHQLGL